MPPKPGNLFTEGAALDQAINDFLRSKRSGYRSEGSPVSNVTNQPELPATPLTTMEAILGPETDREIMGRELRNKLRTDMEEKAKGSQNSTKSSSKSRRGKFVAHLSALPAPLFNGAFSSLKGWVSRKHSGSNDEKISRDKCIGRSREMTGGFEHSERSPVPVISAPFAAVDSNGQPYSESPQERKERLRRNRKSTVYCPPFSSSRNLSIALNTGGHISMTSTDTLATNVSQYEAPMPKEDIVVGNKSLSPTLTRNHTNFGTAMHVQRDSVNSVAGSVHDFQLPQQPVLSIPTRSSSLGVPLGIPGTDTVTADLAEVNEHSLEEVAETFQEYEDGEGTVDFLTQSENRRGQLRRASSVPNLEVRSFFSNLESADQASDHHVDTSKETSSSLPQTNDLINAETRDSYEPGKLSKESEETNSDESSAGVPDDGSPKTSLHPQDESDGQQDDTEPFPDLSIFEDKEIISPEISALETQIERSLDEDEMRFAHAVDTRSTRPDNGSEDVSATVFHQNIVRIRTFIHHLSLQFPSQHEPNLFPHQAQTMAGAIQGADQANLTNIDRENFLLCMRTIIENMEVLFGLAYETRAQVFNVKQSLREHDRHLAARVAANAVAAVSETHQDRFGIVLATVHTYLISMERKNREQIMAAEFKIKREIAAKLVESEERYKADFKRLDAKLDTILAAINAPTTGSRLPVVQGTLDKMPPHIPWGSQAVGGPTLTEPEEEEPEEEKPVTGEVSGSNHKATATTSTKRKGNTAKK